MSTQSNVRKLIVWQKAMALVEMIYSISRSFPKEERYVLTSQLRRAAISIPANIAEGQGRFTRGEHLNLLSNARGSLREVETFLELAVRLQHSKSEDCAGAELICDEISRMITALKRSLQPRAS